MQDLYPVELWCSLYGRNNKLWPALGAKACAGITFEMSAGGTKNDTSRSRDVTYQPSQCPTNSSVSSAFFNITIAYPSGEVNSSIVSNNTLTDIEEPAMNQRLPQKNSSTAYTGWAHNASSNLDDPLKNQTANMISNGSFPDIPSSSNLNSSNPSNWYDYWHSTSKPTMTPTRNPSQEPTIAPTFEYMDYPTPAPSQQAKTKVSNSNNQNSGMISSMTAFISIIIVAAAFYMTKRRLLSKKKTKNKLVIKAPFFSDMSKRVKQRKKLMEEYFEVDAAEGNILHRSAASSVDLQISTEFIDITHENQHNQRAIY